MTRPWLQPCGTDGAYQRHRRDGETPCDDCTRAHQRDQKRRQRTYRHNQRALYRLRLLHPGEYAALVKEEQRKERT